ncbi:MAG: hypothetical protein JWO38_2548 [Gemmataceae bacterium]|nr:hypothetical protein [Gemmataceae bacterium]
MRTKTAHGGPRRRSAVVTRDDLLLLLNEDFVRECRAIYGYAVYTERLKAAGRRKRAAAVERRGKLEVAHAMALCQVIYDFGGTVTAPVDELNAVLNADRVAAPTWGQEGARRLKDRAGQLRAIGEPGLAKRLNRVAAVKGATPDLAALVLHGDRTSES